MMSCLFRQATVRTRPVFLHTPDVILDTGYFLMKRPVRVPDWPHHIWPSEQRERLVPGMRAGWQCGTGWGRGPQFLRIDKARVQHSWWGDWLLAVSCAGICKSHKDEAVTLGCSEYGRAPKRENNLYGSFYTAGGHPCWCCLSVAVADWGVARRLQLSWTSAR